MQFGRLLSILSVLSMTLMALPAVADDAPSSEAPASSSDNSGDTVKPMFDGKFKCSDGYDPDTDATLHPTGQNPRTRELVNAQAREKHEQQIKEEGGGAEKSGESKGSSKVEENIPNVPEEKKEGKKEEKKEEKDKKEKEKEKAEGKEEEKKKAEEKRPAINTQEAGKPINQALYALQTKNYQESANVLNGILAKDGRNAQAHYLLAISYVGLRRYDAAREQYNLVLKNTSDPKLIERVNQGLQKLGH